MKKLIPIIALLLVALVPTVASAGTITGKIPIFWYGRQGDFEKHFAGTLQFSGSNGNSIQIVTFNNFNFDEDTYITVFFWQTGTYTPEDQYGNPLTDPKGNPVKPQPYKYTLGSTYICGKDIQIISCPEGTNELDFYGSAGGQVYPAPMPWSYVSQETDSSGNTYTLPAPPTPQ